MNSSVKDQATGNTASPTTTRINLLQAVNSALDTAMSVDPRVVCLGEDVGKFGGVFRATSNLQEKHGSLRCFNTPLTEQGIAGFAIGLAAQGSVPWLKYNLLIISFPPLIKLLMKPPSSAIAAVMNLTAAG